MTVYALDLDGTLSDSAAAESRAIGAALGAFLGDTPDPQVQAAFRRALHSLAIRSEGVPVDDDFALHFWRHALAAAVPDRSTQCTRGAVAEVAALYQSTLLQEIRLYPEVPQALQLLSGHPLVVLTNGFSQFQREKLRALGIDECFRAVFPSGDVGARKPSHAFFAAVARAGFAPSDTVFFGNDPLADVHGGKLAGMRTAWITRDRLTFPEGLRHPDAEGPDLLTAAALVLRQH